MYADRVEAGAKRSVYERLNGTSLDDSGRRRQFTGKRFYLWPSASIRLYQFKLIMELCHIRKRPLQLMDEKEEWVDINTNGEDNRAISEAFAGIPLSLILLDWNLIWRTMRLTKETLSKWLPPPIGEIRNLHTIYLMLPVVIWDCGEICLNNSSFLCRQRQDDDKWEHDLYEDGETQISNRKVGARDLRLKLQKKVGQQVPLSGKGSLSGGVRDLREKLSGTMHSQPVNNDPPKAKPAMEAGKPTRKNVAVEAPVSGTKKVASQVPRNKTQQKAWIFFFFFVPFCALTFYYCYMDLRFRLCINACLADGSGNILADTSVDGFLQSLGLEKYLITFQAEEVDMTALIHMTDEDLKAMGIPMGASPFYVDRVQGRRYFWHWNLKPDLWEWSWFFFPVYLDISHFLGAAALRKSLGLCET
ncbi:hypothetical protein CK203_037160 [Vitis vinifera]|uniref:SAM domain-containing protein n=1 Tax=Vitis vinifera TaxID=29760 RepID=A0A438HS64_VITVI|nr:hypothetical protein CK203_037160 [Vitis vinifera]